MKHRTTSSLTGGRQADRQAERERETQITPSAVHLGFTPGWVWSALRFWHKLDEGCEGNRASHPVREIERERVVRGGGAPSEGREGRVNAVGPCRHASAGAVLRLSRRRRERPLPIATLSSVALGGLRRGKVEWASGIRRGRRDSCWRRWGCGVPLGCGTHGR